MPFVRAGRVAAAVLLAAACGSDPQPEVEREPGLFGTYEADLAFDSLPAAWRERLPDPLSVRITLDDRHFGSDVSILLSVPRLGAVSDSAYLRPDGDGWSAQWDSLDTDLVDAGCRRIWMGLEDLSLTRLDRDGDGLRETVELRGTAELGGHDYSTDPRGFFEAATVAFTMEASPAAWSPSAVRIPGDGQLPIEPVTVRYSEPVRVGPGAQLLVDGVEIPAAFWPWNEEAWSVPTYAVQAFPKQPLPFGRPLALQLDGRDLDMRPLTEVLELGRVVAEPDLHASLGFEGGTLARYVVTGDVEALRGSQELPASEGDWLAIARGDAWSLGFFVDVPETSFPYLALTVTRLADLGYDAGYLDVALQSDGMSRELRTLDTAGPGSGPPAAGFAHRGEPEELELDLSDYRGRLVYVQLGYFVERNAICPAQPRGGGFAIDAVEIRQ